MLNFEGTCKRIDLRFRSKYPFYTTELYQISNTEFQIYLVEEAKDFESLKKEFDYSITFASSPVYLVNKRPKEFERKIDAIDDTSLAGNYEGLPFTGFQLSNHLECQHPKLKVCKLETDHDKKIINVYINISSFNGSTSEIEKTLENIGSSYSTSITVTEEEKNKKQSSNIFEIVPASSLGDFDPGYLERDEHLWFDNIHDIYNGSFQKSDLFFYDNKTSKCLLDLSVFSNINIRNHLLLYDVVYCMLPLSEKMEDFLLDQKLSKDDLLYLIESGRFKIINSQPESRLDHQFLRDCYNTNPESIISRRAISALIAIDIANIHSNYVFNDINFIKDIDPILSDFSKINKQPDNYLKKVLTWPTSALRSSFDLLNTISTKSIPSFGVNKIIIDNLPNHIKDKCALEFLTSSEAIHISHALDATYFPFYEKTSGFTDQPFSALMANSLNFYKLSSLEYLSDIDNKFNPELERNLTLELLSIFEINDYIPIEEYLEAVENPLSRNCLNRLFSELSSLDDHERNNKIKLYNKEVNLALKGRRAARGAIDLSVDTAGLFIPFISSGAKALSWFGKRARDESPLFKEMSNYVSDKAHSSNFVKKETSILTQINRVARLKRPIL